MLSFDATERRRRLGRRHRLAPAHRAADATHAADGVVALHGTDATSVFISAWARMRDGSIAAVEQTLYEERALVRVLAMRRTMWVATVDTAGVLIAAGGRGVAANERKKAIALIETAGHGGENFWEAAERAALEVLAREGEVTAPELAGDHQVLSARVVLGPGSAYETSQSVASRVLGVLGADGRAVRSRPRGTWTSAQYRWAALSHWQPAVRTDLDTDEARISLAARWLTAFGPATVEDLKWWTGWGLGVTLTALAALDTVEVGLGNGATGLVLADDTDAEPDPGPWVALLPALDPTTMGWRGRDWYLAGHGPELFDRNGNAGTTAWVDGRVVGCWVQDAAGVVHLSLLDDVPASRRRELEAEAARLTRWLGGTRVGTVYPSPAMKDAREQVDRP